MGMLCVDELVVLGSLWDRWQMATAQVDERCGIQPTVMGLCPWHSAGPGSLWQ